jgi:hypothetical protein
LGDTARLTNSLDEVSRFLHAYASAILLLSSSAFLLYHSKEKAKTP